MDVYSKVEPQGRVSLCRPRQPFRDLKRSGSDSFAGQLLYGIDEFPREHRAWRHQLPFLIEVVRSSSNLIDRACANTNPGAVLGAFQLDAAVTPRQRVVLSQCGIWRSQSDAMGQERRFRPDPAMSVVTPFATPKADMPADRVWSSALRARGNQRRAQPGRRAGCRKVRHIRAPHLRGKTRLCVPLLR